MSPVGATMATVLLEDSAERGVTETRGRWMRPIGVGTLVKEDPPAWSHSRGRSLVVLIYPLRKQRIRPAVHKGEA